MSFTIPEWAKSPFAGGGTGPGGAVDSVFGRTGDVAAQNNDYSVGQISGLAAALNAKEDTIPAGTTSQYYRGDKTFQALDKSAVGLGNVNNTSDLSKPISTATQSELDLKANKNNAALTGTPTAPTASPGTNTTQLATTEFVRASVAESSPAPDPQKVFVSGSIGNDINGTGSPSKPFATLGPAIQAVADGGECQFSGDYTGTINTSKDLTISSSFSIGQVGEEKAKLTNVTFGPNVGDITLVGLGVYGCTFNNIGTSGSNIIFRDCHLIGTNTFSHTPGKEVEVFSSYYENISLSSGSGDAEITIHPACIGNSIAPQDGWEIHNEHLDLEFGRLDLLVEANPPAGREDFAFTQQTDGQWEYTFQTREWHAHITVKTETGLTPAMDDDNVRIILPINEEDQETIAIGNDGSSAFHVHAVSHDGSNINDHDGVPLSSIDLEPGVTDKFKYNGITGIWSLD